MSRQLRTAAVCLLALLAVVSTTFAQSQATTGVIEGRVTDESGGVLPGVAVTIHNNATNFETTANTDGGGRFRGVLLPLGPYRVTAALEGFATLVRDGLDLKVGQTIALELQLQISAVSQEIVVRGEAPVVETSRTEGSTRIGQEEVSSLPNNGRNFLDFTKLTPGVTVVQGPDGDELSINGQKGINNNVSVDGADFNNPFFGEQRGGQRPPFTFNLDAIQEVVVVADGAPAEFGRSSGGFVNVVTKSGTNDLSGSAHAFYKDDQFSSKAAKPDGGTAEKFDGTTQQVGFTLGGPLAKDRVFFFLAGDYQNADRTKQTDPNRIEQRVVDLFASLGSPNENGSISRTDDAKVALAKVDWMLSESNLLTGRYVFTDSVQENGTFDVDSWGRSANAAEKDYSHAGTLNLISTIHNSLFNELRAQYAKEWRPRPYEGPLVAGQNRPLPDTAFDFGRAYRFGMPFFIPVKYNDDRKQLTDNVSYLTGNHSFKGGVEYNEVASSQTFIGFANGRYIFSSTDGFINYVHNPHYVECSDGSSSETGHCPAGTSITGPVLLYLQQAGVGGRSVEEAGTQTITQKEPSAFIQDQWQPSASVTVQLGLRWDALLNPDPITPADEVFFADFIGQTRNGQEFPSDGNIPDDKGMFQPRLGFAWAPGNDGHTVVRATAGIFNARIPALSLASTRSTNGSVGRTIFRNSALTDILGPVPAYPDIIPVSETEGPVFFPDVFVFDKDFQNPKTYAYSLSWEQQVWGDMAILLKGNYAKTDHITRFINRNDAVFGSPWSSGLEPGGGNGIGTLTSVESTAKSRYWGITVGTHGRVMPNLQMQVYYTYSKDKSDDDNERDPFSFRYARADRLDAEYGYSDRDQRHRLNAIALWACPVTGIEVNARYSYRSAQPKSIKADGSDAQTPQDRINPDGSVTTRNLGRKDNAYNGLDLRISRPFELGGFTLEPILEVFNVFNSNNFKRPETTSLIFNFDGTVQSGAGEPRQAQLGLRLAW
jgi:hypothetical protein